MRSPSKRASLLFVYADVGTKNVNFSPAIQLLSAVVKRAGFSVAAIHINDAHGIPDNDESILEEIEKHQFDVVAFTATSFQYERVNAIAGLLKNVFSDKMFILGGTHATIKPDDLELSSFDAFCIGEGDESLPELLGKIEAGVDCTDTENFQFRLSERKVKRNPMRHFVRDLNSLPFWDMEILDMPKLLEARGKWLSISFSRGCPYGCSFCINPLLLEMNAGDKEHVKHYFRKRSVDNVTDEIEAIVEKFRGDVEVINFDDDLLMLDKKWMLEFTRKYREKVFANHGVRYVLNCRVNTLDDEIASGLAESGCFELRIGFETGDEILRNEVLNKNVSNRRLVRAFQTADKYGIHTNAFAMMGIPGETRQTIMETVRMISILEPYLIRMTFLYPYYHTDIFDYCVKEELIKAEYETLSDSFTESPLKFECLTDAELFRYRFLFPWYVNARLCGEFASGYIEKSREYEVMEFEELRQPETFERILADDTELSSQLAAKEVPHYKYFSANLYYFQLEGKYGF